MLGIIELTPELVQQIRILVADDPALFQAITGTKRAGRPKQLEKSKPMTPTVMRKRKPRKLSPESQAKMMENLAKGRAKLQALKSTRKLSKVAVDK